MNNKHQPDLSSTRTESSGHYHCSIYAIEPLQPKQWTGPYANVDELVQMTGLPYAEWLKQNPKPKSKYNSAERFGVKIKKPKVNIFDLLRA